MKNNVQFFIVLLLLLNSCKKNDIVNTITPPIIIPIIEKDSLTVKSINQTFYDQNDSTSSTYDEFNLDTLLNKITLSETATFNNITTAHVRVYNYNSKKQLISIEDDGLPNIEFKRDAFGKLLTSTTHYFNAIVNESIGTFTYQPQGAGISITYLDSILKFPGLNPYDARSFYKYSFLPDSTVATYEQFYISTNGDYNKETYTYDNNKNLISAISRDSIGNILNTTTYLRESIKHTTLTSFFKRLGGDLFWFYQSKRLQIIPSIFNEFDHSFALSAPKKITFPTGFNGSLFSTFDNTYDTKGNLISTVESNDSGKIISKTDITYNP